MPSQKKIYSFLFFVFCAMILEWIGHLLTMTSVRDWYITLKKPEWNPPAYVFAPVWTLLYWMIAIAGWRIYIYKGLFEKKRKAFVVYGLQFALNVIWSFCFFFLRSPLLGVIEIGALLTAILWNIKVFYQIERIAGMLLIPYFIWTFYAALLNLTIWSLNR
ncbi:MAG: tryptophan-rich sensory protein [Verrucomicrobia bacterium]|nr:tryptophan-rich sensory protein [Verrucomicrobiota bacterium]